MLTSDRLVRSRTQALACMATALAAVASTLLSPASRAATDRPEWDHDWVAVTVARNGAWGAATNGSIMRAMIQAIAACRRMSGPGGSGDCGGEITTVRASWSLAYACGEYTFIANGDTSAEARLAAIDRAVDLKEILGLELAPCTLLVVVDSEGRASPAGERREILSVPRDGR